MNTLATAKMSEAANATRGFTLVEIAIVVTVIGLLVGGILKGQEMIRSSRATATIAQIESYQTAVNTFRDTYGALPGDLPQASRRIPGCNDNCDPHPVSGGNQIIGDPTWASAWISQAGTDVHLPAMSAADETILFWAHLTLSNLISGVNNTVIRNGHERVAWTHTHPITPLGGGFIVGYTNGSPMPGDPRNFISYDDPLGPRGLAFMIVNTPQSGGDALRKGSQQVMSVKIASSIDTKIDDGHPHTGRVRAYGVPDLCYGGDAGSPRYAARSGLQDCGLLFEMDE